MLLHEVLENSARQAPDTVALVTEAGRRRSRSWPIAWRHVAAGVAAITEPGDRVAILAENCAEYVECYYAVPRAGRLLVPINQRLHPDEWRGTLQRSGARVLIAEPDLLAAAAVPTAGVEVVIELEPRRPRGPRSDEPLLPTSIEDDVTWLIGTSGTTGTPKLAMLTHASLMAAVDATLAARPVRADDVFCTPFPLCHVAGYNVLGLHRMGRPVVLMRKYDPARLVELIVEHGVTLLSLAPTMIAMLLDDPAPTTACSRPFGRSATARPRSRPRCCRGRRPLGLRPVAGLRHDRALGQRRVPRCRRAPPRRRRRRPPARRGGSPRPASRSASRSGPTRSSCRADQVMAGYWNDPDASAATLAGGWLHTGDVGRIDDDGLLTVVDRTKDVIVSGGENVASREVEAVLHSHPGVADVAVIGLPDERWGERVAAVVVRRPGDPVSAPELIALARDHLAGFKTPAVGRVRRRAAPQRRGQGAQAAAARRVRSRDAVTGPALR